MKLTHFLNRPFTYLQGTRKKWTYIISASLFAHFFLILFQPYGLFTELRNPINTALDKFLFFFTITCISFFGLMFSQFVLRSLFNFQSVTIKKYIYFFAIEAFVVYAMYFLISFFIPDLGKDFDKELDVFFQLRNYFRAFTVLVFPFLGAIVFEFIAKLKEEVKTMGKQLNIYQHRNQDKRKLTMLDFYDENNQLQLKIPLQDFFYAESSNQYVLIYFLEAGNIKREIIRTRLKNILEQFSVSCVLQCHRSFMVNLMNVSCLNKKETKKYLILKSENLMEIPVSKTYLTSILSEIEKHE